MKNVLITGHRGLVGSALLEEFDGVAYEPRINSTENFTNFLIEKKIETVVHAAGKVGGLTNNISNKIDFYLLNSYLNNIVFESCLNANVKNLVNFSSTCVFPADAKYPLTEDQIHKGEPHWTNDAYAYAKRMMQKLCEYARAKGYNYFTVIPTNVYGERDNYALESCHVIPALIHKCYLSKMNNEDFTVGGSGEPLREFIYAKDLAKITKRLIDGNFDQESVIVSSSDEISIKECANTIHRLMGCESKIVFDKNFPDGQYRKPTDTSRLKKYLGNFEFTSFEVGLESTINWFKNNYETLRK